MSTATAEKATGTVTAPKRKGPSRPMELGFRMMWYILKNRLKGRKRFPLVTMLEPLEMCNLACTGCGRIREYKSVMDKFMPVEEALKAVQSSGAPIVSIAGGEPTIYPQLPELVNELVKRKYFVYCCTNGLLMERMMRKIPSNKYFCWVVHMDGMEELHDVSVARKGVFKRAIAGIEIALNQGYRVCTNTTIFRGGNVQDLQTLFRTMTEMGVEGCMVSPGYDYKAVPNRDLFLSRQESKQIFKEVLDPKTTKDIRFYNNPLFLDFLRGKREYQCTAWSNPTYTVVGWRKPCYPLADGHTQNLTELYEPELWEKKYGVGRDPRCSNCMMHCGFESATIFKALSTPKDVVKLIASGAFKKSGVTAA